MAQRVIITGGSGGLGSAVVADCLANGAEVFVPYRQPEEFARLQAELGNPAALSGAIVDLTDPDAVAAAFGAFAEQGGIDGLVNLAGGFGGGKPVHQSGWALWEAQLAINLQTTVIACQSAIPYMLERGGSIITTSSRTATQTGARLAAYAAAKRAILQLTEALAEELKANAITVNALLPSVIDTPANRAAMPNADYGAWVQPSEIAAVVRFLLGPDARIISGAAIPVYGRA